MSPVRLTVADDPALFRAGLSRREMEVLVCLTQEKTAIQIADQLYISENTVKSHIHHIFKKLEAANRAEAVSKAVQLGLVESKPS